MRRPIFIVILSAVSIVILVFLLRRNNPTDAVSRGEVKTAPAHKFQASRAGKPADAPPLSHDETSSSRPARIAENVSSNRSQILTLDNLRALAAKSKDEAEHCSRKRFEPIEKQFKRLLNGGTPETYRAEARKLAAEFDDIPYYTQSASKVLFALASDSGQKLSERDYPEIAYNLKYCDAIGAFNVAKAMFALLERHPNDHEFANDLWGPLLRYVASGSDGPAPLLHQSIRIEILRGAVRAGLIDPSSAALIDALVAERDQLTKEIRKDIDAYSFGGEAAKSFRSELEKSERLSEKISEALQKL